jgi:DNA-binding CsgD family transcriptional regulator
MFQGLRQQKEAKRGLEGLERPEYQTPEEISRLLNISQNRYADKFMPGQGGYMDRIEQQAANAFTQSSEAGNPFALIANIQGQAGQQLEQVNTQAMNMQLQNEKEYQKALQIMAGQKDQEWQLNKFAPYSDKYNEYRDMFGAAKKNIYGGLDSLSGIATGMIGSMMGSFGGIGKGAGAGGGINQEALDAASKNFGAAGGGGGLSAQEEEILQMFRQGKLGKTGGMGGFFTG